MLLGWGKIGCMSLGGGVKMIFFATVIGKYFAPMPVFH